MVALSHATAEFGKQIQSLLGFDPLGDDRDLQPFRQVNQELHDRHVVRIGHDVRNERSNDLNFMDGQFFKEFIRKG